MRKLLLTLVLLVPLATLAKGSHGGGRSPGGKTHVRSYLKKDGTHVNAHNRTKADKTKANNWSTKGNTNPDTGEPGTKDP